MFRVYFFTKLENTKKTIIESTNISSKISFALHWRVPEKIYYFNLKTLETRCYVKNPKCYEDVLLLNL